MIREENMSRILKKLDIVSYLYDRLNLDNVAVIFTILDFEKNWEFSDVVLKQIKEEDKHAN
jgi:hypothetical protein